MDKISYAMGMAIGHQLLGMDASEINIEDFALAIKDLMNNKKPALSDAEAQQLVNEYLKDKEAQAAAKHEDANKAAKEAGIEFLKKNAEKEGVITTASGLQYMVLTEGNGKSPKATDQVKCHYEGMLIDGTLFDSSLQRGTPATFPLNRVIAGWTEGLQLMKEGSKFRFFIPFELGYGPQGAGASIPPYSTLIFDVELIEVI